MKKPFIFVLAVVLSVGCSRLSYSPFVIQDDVTERIDKIVEVKPFVDKSPEKDSKYPVFGYAVTDKEALASDIGTQVSAAIVDDFIRTGLFTRTSRNEGGEADYIINGSIKRFMGKSKLTQYGYVSAATIIGILTWYLPVDVLKIDCVIEIEMEVHDKSGVLIGTYTGMCAQDQTSTMYKDISFNTPALTNRCLSDVVSQIRKQIVADMAGQ